MTRITNQQLKEWQKRNPDLMVSESIAVKRPAIPASVGNDVLASKFNALWRQFGGQTLVEEYRFDQARRWRFDYAHPATKIAVELEGGIYSGGRHIRPLGFVKDAEKYNAATLQGWSVFRFATGQVTPENVQRVIEFIYERTQRNG